jgi:hypothetical protein
MSRPPWSNAPIEADNGVGSSEPFLYFPQTTTYPTLPHERLLIRSAPAESKRRHLIVQSAWASTKAADAPLYGHAATLAQLGIRPGLPAAQRARIDYRQALWRDVLLWGDKVALSVAVALLTVISTALGAFVAYEDHPKGTAAILTLIVLVVASVAAIINVVQQFVD